MKTHELAKHLRILADTLSRFPDTNIASLSDLLTTINSTQQPLPLVKEPKAKKGRSESSNDSYNALKLLRKREVVELIESLALPIAIDSKDSSKYLTSKIRRHLNQYPSDMRRVNLFLRRKRPATTSEPLSKALETLLGNRDEIPTTDSR